MHWVLQKWVQKTVARKHTKMPPVFTPLESLVGMPDPDWARTRISSILRSLISEKRQFSEENVTQSNQTHEGPDRELRLSDQIALQNRLIVSIGPTAESHIRRSGFVRTCRRKLQIACHTLEPTLCATNSAMQFQDAIYLESFFFIGGFFSAPLVLINAK